jgi:hypothetical protein
MLSDDIDVPPGARALKQVRGNERGFREYHYREVTSLHDYVFLSFLG